MGCSCEDGDGDGDGDNDNVGEERMQECNGNEIEGRIADLVSFASIYLPATIIILATLTLPISTARPHLHIFISITPIYNRLAKLALDIANKQTRWVRFTAPSHVPVRSGNK